MKEGDASVNAGSERSQPITVASLLFVVFGLGMALADPPLLAYLAYYRTAPVLPLIGDVLDGSTPIGMLGGLDAVLALGVVLVATAILEVVAGWWLWKSLRRGGKLGIALVPLNLFFAVGFGIPILYVLAPLRTILLASGWKSLR
jgi:hypothetical protein